MTILTFCVGVFVGFGLFVTLAMYGGMRASARIERMEERNRE